MADIQTVLSELLRQAGMSASQISTDAVSGWQPGMVVSNRVSLQSIVEALQSFWQFEVVETAGTLTFSPRGQAAVLTIPEDDFLPLQKTGHPLEITRKSSVGMPEALEVVYRDHGSDGQAGAQRASRSVAAGATPVTVDVPLVLTADMARRQAQLLLDAAWAERTELRFALPLKYLALEAGDVVTLQSGGRTWTVRLLKVTYQNGVLQCEAVTTDATAYVQQAVGEPLGVGSGVIATGAGTLLALDIPLVEGSDDTAALFFVTTKTRGDRYWRFATVYESVGGSSYTPLSVLSTEGVTGTASTILSGNAPTAFFDNGNTVTVVLADGVLQNALDAELLSGANTALLGTEIVQFGTAELTAPYTYKLSRLLRGRRGTEAAMSTHVMGEPFVLLGSSVQRVPLSLGIPRQFKAVVNGQSLEDAAVINATPTGASLKPLSPVHLKGNRDGSGNLTLSWIRRTRREGAWLSGSDVPLGEEREAYTVEILNGAVAVRTLDITAPSAIYTAAQQVTDFGSVQSSVSVRVSQVSSTVGRGSAVQGLI